LISQFAEWNEKGGLLGKKVQLVPGDDQADPKQAVSIANKFIHQKVNAVVGHWNSNCSINASTYYHTANIVSISPASTNPRLTLQGIKPFFACAAPMINREALQRNLS